MLGNVLDDTGSDIIELFKGDDCVWLGLDDH